uniref:dephospho-CoA kinase n=1 Tax=Flavobacterium sp. TaxID=239 RepID=UPI00404AAFBD
MTTRIIGLTGGIGSGKTTVAKVFDSLGVPIYIADLEAKRVMESQEVIGQVKDKFGVHIIKDDKIDRVALAQIVFGNEEKLSELNKIVHPAVANDFKIWLATKQNFPFVIKESAILFETNGDKNCFKTILVTATKETRIKRVMNRDQIDEKQVLQRMQHQWEDEKKKALADFIIQNDDNCDLFNIVQQLIKTLNNL